MTGPTPMAYLLPHLVERRAETDPQHPALRYRGDELTYAELFSRAAALANGLVDDGAQPGDRMGILANKGLEAAVALYGIMLAGGVYVPLDPLAPSSRTRFVIDDCGIRRLVAGPGKEAAVQALEEAGVKLDAVFGLDGDGAASYRAVPWTEIDGLPAKPPSIPTTEQDLCYILYTSGSTGTPKGIMHTHRSARAWADVSASVYGLGPADVISNYAPLHFDLSTLDYFGGARAGATTVIIPEEYTRFPASLAGLIADERLTVFYTVPMALIQLAQPGLLDGRDLSRLRLVIFGGEPMPVKHLRTVMSRLPGAEFVNLYGPTETNGCTHHRIAAAPPADGEPLPIGRPLPNVEAKVVDGDLLPVTDGEPGELLIRAPTMMRGYWARPDLNRDAFDTRELHGGIPDVFHRTGDLVRRRSDGEFDFLGRRDRQIKSRGCRVDLDEVEATLVGHPEVHEAAVYAVPNAAGTLEIHAEVVPGQSAEPAPTALLGHLRAALPPYAMPVTIGLRDAFPRTSTGKIDRRAMAAAAGEQP